MCPTHQMDWVWPTRRESLLRNCPLGTLLCRQRIPDANREVAGPGYEPGAVEAPGYGMDVVRVAAQLTQVSTGLILWSDTIEREVRDAWRQVAREECAKAQSYEPIVRDIVPDGEQRLQCSA